MNKGIKVFRSLLLTGLAGGAIATPAAFAQDAATASSTTVTDQGPTAASSSVAAEQEAADEAPYGDIVVTARRREESLLDVPIAITAVGGAQLERSGAIDITEVANIAPNVTLESARATNSTLSAFIRGVGQQDPIAGFEQGVGIYLDDVYLNRPQAAVLDIYDVERIEVLRGPQGTLYGRNTIGGAVKYVTRRLSAEPTISGRVTYGTYNQIDGVLTGSTPLGSSPFRLGASVARLTRDGFGENLTTGRDNYDKDLYAARLSTEFHSTSFFARLSGDYTRDRSNPRGGHREIVSLLTGTPVLDSVYDTLGGLDSPDQSVEAYGVSLFMEAQPTDFLTFRSISAYREDESGNPIDFDALPAVDLDVPGYYANSQFSQELQVLVNSGRFNGLVGAYYLDAFASVPFDVRLFTSVPGLTAFTDDVVKTNTLAAFGDFTYDFSDQFSVSVGGRYTWDRRYADILRQNYLGGGSPLFGGAGVPLGPPATDFEGSRSYTAFTPRASISFRPSPDHRFYASFSQGFKGGGFDPRGAGVNAPDLNGNGVREDSEVAQFLSFAPERVNSYEIGYKASLFDRRVNLALAAFHADYTDVQIPGSIPCTVNGLTSFCGVTSNAGKARFRGFEAEFDARFGEDLFTGGDRLTARAALGYIDAEYREYVTNIGNVPTDVADFREVQNTPKWTINQSVTYTMPLGAGELDFTESVAYRSRTTQFEIPNPFLDQSGYALIDASIVYRAPGNRWTLGLYGKNLTDERYRTSGYTYLAADPVTGELLTNANGQYISTLGREGISTAFYGNPRQVFVSATFRY